MPAALSKRGFVGAERSAHAVTIRNEAVDIAGIRFWTRRMPHVMQVLKGAGPNTVLLAHDPRRLPQAAELDVPLVLSGHTHGGQVLLPGVGAIADASFRCSRVRRGRSTRTLFVSRGVGTVYIPCESTARLKSPS